MRIRATLFTLLAALVLPSCAFLALSEMRADLTSNETAPVELEQDLRPPPLSPVADLVEEALPSVVNVKGTSVSGRGEGSGVIIDPSGVVLTNAHVVEGSVSVQVAFSDDRSAVEGRVVGAIPASDLAIDRHPLADLFFKLWAERERASVLEIHLKDGTVLVPERFSRENSKRKCGVFALRDADGTYTVTAVDWQAVTRITLRHMSKPPKSIFE